MKKCDLNHDNYITISEFKTLSINFRKVAEPIFRWAFDYFDTNKNGLIELSEMKVYLA